MEPAISGRVNQLKKFLILFCKDKKSEANSAIMSLSILCQETKLIINKCKLKKPGMISTVWTLNGVVKEQIHKGANDDEREIKKSFY